MPTLRFLSVSHDPRPDHVDVVYGPGHVTSFDETDYEYVKTLRLEGRAEILDDTPPQVTNIDQTIFLAPQ